MLQTGTLRKRRRRNLAKVNGLTNVPYNGNEDRLGFARNRHHSDFCTKNNHTALNINSSEFAELRKKSGGIPSSRTRPTRNPLFHRNPEEVFDMDEGQPKSENLVSGTVNENQDRTCEQSSFVEGNGRLYLFDNFTIFCLRKILLIGLTCGALRWKWDNINYKINNCSQRYQHIWKIFRILFFCQTICLTFFQVYTFVALATSGKFTKREIFISSFNLMWHTFWIDFAINMYMHEDQIREYVNTLFKFNNEMVNKYVIDLYGFSHSCRLLTNFATLASISNVFLAVVAFPQMPSAPWFLFSYIYPKPWYWLIPGIIQNYWLVGQVVTSHTLIIWVLVAHTGTVKFWLTESHQNYQTDYTSDEIRKRKTSFEVFKSLKILNSCFNECMSPLFIPMIKVHVCGVAVVLAFIMIRSTNSLFIQELPQSIINPVGSIVCLMQAFIILNVSARMYDLGISFVDSWSLTWDKDFRKALMSCGALKIHVRRFYFITVSTTIKFFQVVSELITGSIISFQ